MNDLIKSNRSSGFSLVELMITVAVLGILSSIAIPKYHQYQMRAKQSEVKIALTSAYLAEKNFFPLFASYTLCLNAVGYQPIQGERYYSVGFNPEGLLLLNPPPTPTPVPGTPPGPPPGPQAYGDLCGPGGNRVCNSFEWNNLANAATPDDQARFLCQLVEGEIYYRANSKVSSAPFIEPNKILESDISRNDFRISGSAVLATPDHWTINSQKDLRNISSGL